MLCYKIILFIKLSLQVLLFNQLFHKIIAFYAKICNILFYLKNIIISIF